MIYVWADAPIPEAVSFSYVAYAVQGEVLRAVLTDIFNDWPEENLPIVPA